MISLLSPLDCSSIISNIDSDVREALGLIHEFKRECAKGTIERLKELLDQYILANMADDITEEKAIQKQISEVISTFISDIHKADAWKEELQNIEKHPGSHLNQDLEYLQGLIHQLKNLLIISTSND